MLLQHLLLLGFNRSEIKTYLGLVESGRASAAGLAKKINLPRTTTYSVLEKLVEKGVVSEEKHVEGAIYVINRPSALLGLVEDEMKRVAAKEQSAKEAIELITPLLGANDATRPRFQFFEGERNVRNMLFEWSDEWHRSIMATDGIIWGYQDASFVEHYMKWLRHHWKTRPKHLRVQLFSNETAIEQSLKDKVTNRFIRPVPLPISFASSVWVHGEYIIMVMTHQRPHFVFQIYNNLFSANLRTLFAWLWKLTEPPRTAPA